MANKGNDGAKKKKKKQEAGGEKKQEAGGEKKKPTPHCLALQEEKGCKKFNEYMQELADKCPGKDICVVESSRGDSQTPGEALLIEQAQTAILRMFLFYPKIFGQTSKWLTCTETNTPYILERREYMDEIEEGWCFSTVSESNTVVTKLDIPKILKDNRVRATEETVTNCVTGLSEMLQRVVFDSSPSFRRNPNINKELRHLLGLIRRYKFRRCTFLIKYHVATVPLINRLILFIKIYDHTVEILRRIDPKAYNTVMMGLDCPANWDNLVRSNSFLLMYFDCGKYDPQATTDGTDPVLEPLKFLRNCPSHAMRHSFSRDGVAFCRFDLARAQYQRFPEVIMSMQTSLHSLGELQALGTQYLFPARIKVTPKGHESRCRVVPGLVNAISVTCKDKSDAQRADTD